MVNKIDLMSDDEFTNLVNECTCIAEVLEKLGYSVDGNSWGYRIVKERMDKLDLIFIKKQKYDRDIPKAKLPLEQVLTKDSGYNRTRLKDRLVEEGLIEYKCACCGLTEWNGKPISLQLHHINGINNDNRLSNLQLLCPNCHSQTENFGTKGKGTAIVRKADLLPKEDVKIIMDTVREFGIVEARKKLSYRNSLINTIVKNYRDTIVMIDLDGSTKEFGTVVEAARYLAEIVHKPVENIRSGISKCCCHAQKTVAGGYQFYRRSIEI